MWRVSRAVWARVRKEERVVSKGMTDSVVSGRRIMIFADLGCGFRILVSVQRRGCESFLECDFDFDDILGST